MKSTAILSIILSLSLGFTSCKEKVTDPCLSIVCENTGTCLDGTCQCPDFYSGSKCEVDELKKLIGKYELTVVMRDTSFARKDSYEITNTLFQFENQEFYWDEPMSNIFFDITFQDLENYKSIGSKQSGSSESTGNGTIINGSVLQFDTLRNESAGPEWALYYKITGIKID